MKMKITEQRQWNVALVSLWSNLDIKFLYLHYWPWTGKYITIRKYIKESDQFYIVDVKITMKLQLQHSAMVSIFSFLKLFSIWLNSGSFSLGKWNKFLLPDKKKYIYTWIDRYILSKKKEYFERKIFLTSIGRIKILLVICQSLSVCILRQRRLFSCCYIPSLALASALRWSRYLRTLCKTKSHWHIKMHSVATLWNIIVQSTMTKELSATVYVS